jgi:hypothetical protein
LEAGSVSRGRSLPDRFGVDYRAAVLAARPRSLPGTILAWVLLDEVFRTKSATVELGYGLLRELTHLHGRSLERGRDWLVGQALLCVKSEGLGRNARTLWTLETSAPARTFSPLWNDRTSAAIKRPREAVNE